jgi:uncharacterized membrane protein
MTTTPATPAAPPNHDRPDDSTPQRQAVVDRAQAVANELLRRDEVGAARVNDPGKAGLNWTTILLLGLGDLLLWGLGIASTFWFFGADIGNAGLAFGVVAPALWTFLMFFRDSSDIRTAFTASFFALYLAFVAASFIPAVGTAYAQQGSFTSAVWANLNTLMIAIVGFYFGGKAVEKAAAVGAKTRKKS